MADKKYQNKEWLTKQYVENNRSMMDIAIECGIADMTVHYWIKKFEIPVTRGKGRKTDKELLGDPVELITREATKRLYEHEELAKSTVEPTQAAFDWLEDDDEEEIIEEWPI